MCDVNNNATPGGTQSTTQKCASRYSDSGESATSHEVESERLGNLLKKKIQYRKQNFIATFNVNSLLKVGKLKHLTDTLKAQNITITALQETRYTDENVFDSEGFRIYKGKKGVRIMKNTPHLGTGFIINKNILDSILDFESHNERLSLLTFKSTNKIYTIVNAHAPINKENRTNSEKVELFWDKLDDVLQNIPDKHNIILLGDFNAQIGKEKKFRKVVGKYPAHKRTNKNGERLIEICQSHNLILKSTTFKKRPQKQKTWVSPNPHMGEFQLDHVAIKRIWQKEIQNVKVLKSANLDSDHYLTKIKFKVIPQTKIKSNRLKTRRIDPEKLILNSDEFSKATENLKREKWESIKTKMIQQAETVASFKRTKKHAWWTSECDDLIKIRQEAWQKWNSTKSEENREAFVNIRKQVSKKIKHVKKISENERLNRINENFTKNNSRNFYQTFKQALTKYNPPSLQLEDEDGKKAHNNTDNCKILAKYFQKLLNCEKPKEIFNFKTNNNNAENSTPPDLDEIERIVKELKNNKASGESLIVAEMWKTAHINAKESLAEIFKDIWKKEEIPNDWKSALIHPLHKKGSKTDPNNYRGISLLEVTYKILSKALLNRADYQLDSQIGEYQGGFRKSRSCVEQIFNLKSIMEYCKCQSRTYVITFIDFQKAYDSIDRSSLFLTLKELGLDNKTISIIKATLTDTYSKVKFLGELSDPFLIETGVRQGDGLSPLLFNCALEKVVREWNKNLDKTSGIKLGTKGLKVNCLAFADDMALIAKNWEEAEQQIKELEKQAAKIGLKISFEKTKILTNIKNSPNSICINENKICKVDHFKYLGEWISWNSLDKKALVIRANKVELAFQLTKNIYNKKSLSWNSKLRHYKTVIKPEALYAAETLRLCNKGLIENLEKKERKIIRKILGTKFQNNQVKLISNDKLYTKIEKISDTMRKRRIAFYSHLVRMKKNRLTKQIFDFLQSKKTKSKWFTQVEEDLKELKISGETIKERQNLKKILNNESERFQEAPKRTRPKLSEQRKKEISERMKRYWSDRKAHDVRK